jgi:hypothetical protein
MAKKYWTNGEDTGIVLDADSSKITIWAGNTSVQLNGGDGRLIMSGSITEMHGGERIEDTLLQREASIKGLIPSTMLTPIPQLSLHLPLQGISGLINDISKMIVLLS